MSSIDTSGELLELTDLRKQWTTAPVGALDPDVLVAAWGEVDTGGRNVLLRQLGAKVTVQPVGRGARVPIGDRVQVDF